MSQKEVNINKNAKNPIKKHGDILAKILSVITAIILWFYVVDTETTIVNQTIEDVPVTVIGLDSSNLCIVSDIDIEIKELVLEGKAGDFEDFSEDSDITAYVDLSDIKTEGKYNKQVKFKKPNGITVKKCTTDSIDVVVEKSVSKVVSVTPVLEKVNIDVELYKIDKLVPSIENITVSGPENAVENVTQAIVRLDVGEIKGSKSIGGKLVPATIDGNEITDLNIELSESNVDVIIHVKKLKQE